MARTKTPRNNAAFIRISEIAALLDVHQNTVYRMLQRADFPVTRLGGVIRIPRKSFMEYLAAHSTAAARISAIGG